VESSNEVPATDYILPRCAVLLGDEHGFTRWCSPEAACMGGINHLPDTPRGCLLHVHATPFSLYDIVTAVIQPPLNRATIANMRI
jgi:hypothetical protein